MKYNQTAAKVLYYVLQWTWGAVQNLLGLILWTVLMIINPKRRIKRFFNSPVTYWKFPFSMGLGMFIFYGHEGKPEADGVLVHEYGHTLQSAVLGPLFMFVIAIPSLIWAFIPAFVKLRKEKNINYVDFYCEKWANNWGEKVTGLKPCVK